MLSRARARDSLLQGGMIEDKGERWGGGVIEGKGEGCFAAGGGMFASFCLPHLMAIVHFVFACVCVCVCVYERVCV